MIYLTSDLHGGDNMKGLNEFLSVCTDDDWLFILGDTEICFTDWDKHIKYSEYMKSLKCNIAFIDGNHENFDYLYSLPEEDWHGGRVHRVSDRIIHLMRGYIFEVEGKSFLTMGGCISSVKWQKINLWWPQEDPTVEEITRAYKNLERYNNCVDYVLTHKYRKDGYDPNADPMTLDGFINYIESNTTYKHYYAGHWHKDIILDDKHTIVYEHLIAI